jgi:hypothetical protein
MATFRVTNVNQVGGGAPVTSTVSGSSPDQRAGIAVVAGAFVAVAIAALIGWIIWQHADPADFQPRSDYTALAAVILFATALERLLEPLSKYLLSDDDEKKSADTAKKTATNLAADPNQPVATVASSADQAAASLAALTKKKDERAIVYWAIATCLAFTGPALFGIFFLRVVSIAGAQPNRFLDMLLTALIVGAGTKPVHDAITSIQASKTAAQDS